MTPTSYDSVIPAIRSAAHALGWHYWSMQHPEALEETPQRAMLIWAAACRYCGVMERRVLTHVVQANKPDDAHALMLALAIVLEAHVHVEPDKSKRAVAMSVADVCIRGFFGHGLSVHRIWRDQGGGLPRAFFVRNTALDWLTVVRARAITCAEDGLREGGFLKAHRA